MPDLLNIYDPLGPSQDAARLAFLSACSTARSRVGSLLDGNIHITGTVQVLGTMGIM